MASKNTGNDNVSLADAAFQSEDSAAFTSWLDDTANYVTRKVNGKTVETRRVCSLSCNVPDDIYYAFVQLAAGDKARLDDGDMTYALRDAVWAALGRTDYAEWASAEADRISKERAERMSGQGKERAEKVRSLETDNQRMAAELAELKAMLANMNKGS